MKSIYNQKDFNEEVLNSELPVLAFFEADWCSPCIKMMSLISKIADEYDRELKVVRVDLNNKNSCDVAKKCQVTGIPMTILFKNGVPVGEALSGLVEKIQIRKLIEKHF